MTDDDAEVTSQDRESAFREVAAREPGAVRRTRRKFGAKRARRQRVAIALSKARRAGRRRREL